jgi:hypothetical protein
MLFFAKKKKWKRFVSPYFGENNSLTLHKIDFVIIEKQTLKKYIRLLGIFGDFLFFW